MKSNWVPANPANNIPWANQGDLTKIIDEQIEWYEQNSTRKDDDYIKAQLKLIKNLAESIESSEDILFLKEIFETMCKIIEMQREVISDLEGLAIQQASTAVLPHNYIPSYTVPADGFSNDEQIKAVFTAYMKKEGKSSFTTNDYLLRIQNLWRSFYSECQNGDIPRELAESVIEEKVHPECPLLNAYDFTEELNCYISMKMAGAAENRNWANIRAALNTFGKAVCGDGYEKAKSEPKEAKPKDFSKYLFNGETYGKSRLVLAVVKQYVEDCHPTAFEDLEKAFPSHLQGSLGVVKLIDSVSDKYKGVGGVKRYFVNEDEIIYLPSGERVIVCTQWGVNIDRFIEHAMNKLDYKIKKA